MYRCTCRCILKINVCILQKLVSAADESDDLASSNEDGASDYDVVDTSDESDENDETRELRERFLSQAAKTSEALALRECRFCGKRKSRRTLLVRARLLHMCVGDL